MGRINAWQMAWNLANDRFFGGGFEVSNPFVFALYAPDPTNPLTAHSIYFQMLGEHGWVGLLLFLLLWLLTWITANGLRKGTRNDPVLGHLHLFGSMVQVSLVGYAVGGAFLSLSYFDLPYYLIVMTVVWTRWRQEYKTVDAMQKLEPPPPKKAGFVQHALWYMRTA